MTYTRLDHCRECDARILWVRTPRGSWMPVNADQVSTDSDSAAGAWVVVERRRAYRPGELAEILMTSRNIALEDAREAVRTDFPWHRHHACPPGHEDRREEEQ